MATTATNSKPPKTPKTTTPIDAMRKIGAILESLPDEESRDRVLNSIATLRGKV